MIEVTMTRCGVCGVLFDKGFTIGQLPEGGEICPEHIGDSTTQKAVEDLDCRYDPDWDEGVDWDRIEGIIEDAATGVL